MPDEALQAAFEIKAACDDISRKLLPSVAGHYCLR